MEKLKQLIKNAIRQDMSIGQWIAGFLGVVFVRFLLESISSPAPSGMMPTDTYTLVHYGLFFLALVVGLMVIIGFFGKNYRESGKFILFIFPIMWIAPIVDIALSRSGFMMSYIYALPKELFMDFLRLAIFLPVAGTTIGMHVQIFIFFVAIGYYIWKRTGNPGRVALALASSYTYLFILGALPSLIYIAAHIGNAGHDPVNILYYLNDIILHSNIFHNTLHETAQSVSPYRFFQLGFDKLLSQILFLISIAATTAYFAAAAPEKLKTILKNMRPHRILYYVLPLIMSMMYAYFIGLGSFSSWADALGVVCLLVSAFGMWMYSVHMNDMHDVGIDKISNADRPLVRNAVTSEDMRNSGYAYLAMAVVGSWCAGFYPFFFILVGTAIAYIYSAPPLRLRQFPLISSFTLAAAVLCATLSGFFFASADKLIHTFPTFVALGILVFFTLEVNFKDMKDMEGDEKNGVITVPVLFGKNGTHVVGTCFALSFLVAPIFLSFYTLYIISIPVAILGYKAITRVPYREKTVFILHFSFFLGMILLSSGIYLLATLYHLI
jgi:homogentisate phytyltransferase/homogentisate geranylgeranyltransferase